MKEINSIVFGVSVCILLAGSIMFGRQQHGELSGIHGLPVNAIRALSGDHTDDRSCPGWTVRRDRMLRAISIIQMSTLLGAPVSNVTATRRPSGDSVRPEYGTASLSVPSRRPARSNQVNCLARSGPACPYTSVPFADTDTPM